MSSSRFYNLWKFISRPGGYVGKDLQGNRYYERVNPHSSWMKRSVKYVNYDDYIGGSHRIPAQWYAWLSHTRQDPPSIQELTAETQRQERLAQNVARIEQQVLEERLILQQQQQREPNPQALPPPERDSRRSSSSPSDQERHLFRPAQENYQPESWVPKANSRRGE